MPKPYFAKPALAGRATKGRQKNYETQTEDQKDNNQKVQNYQNRQGAAKTGVQGAS
jgi:hypothetical protein